MALLLQAYGTPAQHRPSASGEGLAFAPISHLCGGPRARDSAPRHRTSAACDSRRSRPARPLGPRRPPLYLRAGLLSALRLKTRHREIACACAHGPPSPSPWAMPAVPGTVRRRRGGRRGVRACTSPALPSAHTHSGLRAPRPDIALWPARRGARTVTDLPSRLEREGVDDCELNLDKPAVARFGARAWQGVDFCYTQRPIE